MGPVLATLRAAHCRSTHHYIAVDALPLVETDAGKRLVSCLLRHHRRYLAGAVDPDLRFRDFQNHVVHVRDGYWGGAPRVAHLWYSRLQTYLHSKRWSDAAHAAGVLSHYFTDPMQPLHTEFCDRQVTLHRPIETSIRVAYARLHRQWCCDNTRVVFQLSDRTEWLAEAILHAARLANRHYHRLLDDYRLGISITDPAASLTPELRSSLSDLIGLAVTGWARVLERAALEAEQATGKRIPLWSVTPSLGWAAVRAPDQGLVRWWTRRSELRQWSSDAAAYQEGSRRPLPIPAEVDVIGRVLNVVREERQWLAARTGVVRDLGARSGPPGESARAVPIDPAGARLNRLAEIDPVEKVPYLGRRLVSRLTAAGITTVADFLAADPGEVARRASVRWIDQGKVRDWQLQANLMCHVPGLCGRDAKLLVGAGYTRPDQIFGGRAETIHRRLTRYGLTRAGRLALGGADPPQLLDVRVWLERNQPARRDLRAQPRRAA